MIKILHWVNVAVILILLIFLFIADGNAGSISADAAKLVTWIGTGLIGAIVLVQLVMVFLSDESEDEKQSGIRWFSWLTVFSTVVLMLGVFLVPFEVVGGNAAALIFFLGCVLCGTFTFGAFLLLTFAKSDEDEKKSKSGNDAAVA